MSSPSPPPHHHCHIVHNHDCAQGPLELIFPKMPPQEGLQEPLLSLDLDGENQLATTTTSEEDASFSPPPATTPSPNRAHHNVTLTLLYTILAFVGSSIWGNNVLATYVYLLKDQNAADVGYFTGVMGTSNLLCSLPAGYWADRHRRDTVLRVAAILRGVAIATAIYALVQASYVHLILALAVWGSSRGTANTAMGAIFADSIQQGKRSHYFTQRTMLRTIGSTAGPIASCVMFVVLGDQWTLRDCSIVLIVGQVISVAAMCTLCFFNDGYILEHQEMNGEEEDNAMQRRESESNEQEEDNTDETDDTTLTMTTSWFRQRRVAILIATSDIITGLASGMSVRYFPIFFVENLNLGPVMVQLLYVFGPFFQTILMRISQRLSETYGRCFISALFRWIGVALMVAMILSHLIGLSTWIVCALYVFRTGCMNGTKALTRSVLMDNVPKEERGRWSALESVNTLSWSGRCVVVCWLEPIFFGRLTRFLLFLAFSSAVIGGFLVGSIGILPLFVATACLQICSTIPLVVLFVGRYDQFETAQRNS